MANIDPSVNFIVVGNKNSDNLTVFGINYDDGMGKEVDQVTLTAPQCVYIFAIQITGKSIEVAAWAMT